MASNSNAKILSRDILLQSHLPPTGQGTQGNQQHQPTTLNIRYYKPLTLDPSAPTVLLLPFWGGSASTFEPVQLELSKTHPSLISIAVSYRGTGSSRPQESSSPASSLIAHDAPETHDIPALAADVVALLENLEHDAFQLNLIASRKIVICAHSMSAKVAWEVLRVLADRKAITLTGLLLLAPAPPGPLVLPTEMRDQQLKAWDSLESATWTLRNVLTHKSLDDELLARLATGCVKMSPGAKRGWVELGMKRDCFDAVKEVAAQLGGQGGLKDFEVRVLVGQEDKVETVGRVEKETVNVLGALGFTVSSSVVTGVGHLLPVEAPDEVALALGKFL